MLPRGVNYLRYQFASHNDFAILACSLALEAFCFLLFRPRELREEFKSQDYGEEKDGERNHA